MDYPNSSLWSNVYFIFPIFVIVSLHRPPIPVVMGLANYSLVAPPGSVIDVRDFASPAHLAIYLRKVMANRELYNSFHEWRRDYRVFEWGTPAAMCGLCSKAHAGPQSDDPPHRDLHVFWDKASCHRWRDSLIPLFFSYPSNTRTVLPTLWTSYCFLSSKIQLFVVSDCVIHTTSAWFAWLFDDLYVPIVCFLVTLFTTMCPFQHQVWLGFFHFTLLQLLSFYADEKINPYQWARDWTNLFQQNNCSIACRQKLHLNSPKSRLFCTSHIKYSTLLKFYPNFDIFKDKIHGG